MKKILKKIYRKVFPLKKKVIKTNIQSFEINSETQLSQRKYKTYDDYINHQSEKLGKKFDQIKEYDLEYEKIVYDRYRKLKNIHGASILCLAARLGGEVRAFKNLGALAIGIDLEPGEKNSFVLHGDFHNIQFADETFDYAFTNAIDHVYELETYLKEVKRVLRKGAQFIVELAVVDPSSYEVLDTKNPEPIINLASKHFKLISINELSNNISFVNWNGQLLVFEK